MKPSVTIFEHSRHLITDMADEDTDNVKFADQQMINEFGRLNNRLLELRAERQQGKLDVEKIGDALSDLEMLLDGKAMLLIGEAFVECDEEYANEYLEGKQSTLNNMLASFDKEEEGIITRQAALKKDLYGKFGDSINLEN
jgi:prefoldin subunit 4